MRIPTTFKLIPILLAAGGLTLLTAQSIAVDKTTMSFSAQSSGPVQSQQLTITSSAGTEQFSIFSSTTTNPQWLKVSGQTVTNGNTPLTVTVTADPAGLQPGTYNATLTVFGALSSVSRTVNVTLTVSNIGVSPSTVTFQPYTQGGTIPLPQSITISGSGGFGATAATTNGGPWLSVTPTSGQVPGAVTATLNASIVTGLAVGTYQGTITISPIPNGNPVTVPVTLQVAPTPPVTVNPGALIFNAQQGGTNNIATQTLTISTNPGVQMNFGLQAAVASGPNWITLSPTSGNTDATTGAAQVTVGYSLTGLTVGNTYTGTIILVTPGGTPVQTNIPVTLVYSANPLLNVPTNTLSFAYQLGGATPAAKSVNITATSGTLAYAISQSANSPWLSVPNAGSTAAPISVSVNPAGLAPGTYTASISITSATQGSSAQQIPVVLKVTNDPMITTNTTAMAFAYQVGQTFGADRAQTLKITSSTGVPLNFTATPSVTNCGSNWLLLNGAGNAVSGGTDGTLTVSIVTTSLTAGTCTGSINITATIASTGVAAVNSPLSIPVTVTVATTPLLVATPASLFFSAPFGASPGPQTVALTSTSGSTDTLNYTITSVSGTANGITWLFAGPTSGNTASSSTLTVSIFSSTLPAGTYNGTITVAATKSDGTTVLANSPVVIPVTMQVTAGSLTLSSTNLSFAYTIGGSSPAAQTVTVGSTNQALVFTAVATTNSQGPWLSVTPSSGNTNGSGALSVAVDATKLTTAGTFTGTITVTSAGAGNSPATINVTVVVAPGTISAPTATLSFIQVAGGAAPAAQTIAVTGSPAPLSFTVAATTTPAGGTWLTATPASGTTPGSISVSVNGANLQPGQYSGQVTITSTGANGSPIAVPVVLNVTVPATVTASPTSLSFNYTIGQQAPATQTLTIGTNNPVAITATIQYQTGQTNGWLTVAPTQTSAPASLAVTAQPGSLAAGTYNATIAIASPNLLTAISVPVTFTVVAIPKPVIVSIGNAANYSTGPLSPGENIVIFGTGIGPASLAQNGLTNNAFGTVVGNTRVLFDGVPAPMLYASATQTSAMVPYGVFGRTSTNIVVEFSGVQSTGLTYNVVGAAPGIYTLNQAGTGPGAIINQDGVTVNGPNAPEKRGNVISVYMTGEGQTSPAGVDGAIIPPVLSALKTPLLPVTATVGGLPAVVQYAGSAAGLVSGVMQVNLTIPAGAPTGGAVPIVVTVGTFNSQGGVTVAVQ